jgi:hypothetical protein
MDRKNNMTEHKLSHGSFDRPHIETPTGDPNHTVDEYPHFDVIKEKLKAKIEDPNTSAEDRAAAIRLRQVMYGN